MALQSSFLWGALLASLVALALHVALHSPISPLPLPLPSSNLLINFTSNNALQGLERLGEGKLQGPEDVVVDGKGTLYTATRDGWIKRMHPDGSWEDWAFLGGSALLGLAVSKDDGHLLVCDVDKGLLKASEKGVNILTSQADGTIIRLADDVIEASDGSAYFSDASSRFGLHDWFLDLLEARPNGRLLKYDPSNRKTSVVIPDMYFPNGVALSSGQDFLVVCETSRFRCLKHWLEGQRRGETEVFIDNLPAGPDNINLAPDGSFWIATIQLRSKWLDVIYGSSLAKLVIAAFPKLVEMIKPRRSYPMVINVGADGMITRVLDDVDAKVMTFVTSAFESGGYLYLGSLETNFVGRLPLINP